MKKPTNETVGSNFEIDLLQAARDKTFAVITKAAKLIRAGMGEEEAKKIVQQIQMDMGAPKSWHAPQIRFGENTLLPFGQRGKENLILKEDDIFFLDIGPIFEGHEGDVGRPFFVGADTEMQKCCADAESIWHDVRNRWRQEAVTGQELYRYAETCAEERGWRLCLDQANGHRISDFPHAIHIRGTVEEWQEKPAANRWILEIQIRHPVQSFGAFYEDLLN